MEIVQSDLQTTSALKVTFFGQYPRVGSFSWWEMFFKLITDISQKRKFVINNWMEIKLGVFILIMKLMRILFVLIIVDVIFVNKTNRLKIYSILAFSLRSIKIFSGLWEIKRLVKSVAFNKPWNDFRYRDDESNHREWKVGFTKFEVNDRILLNVVTQDWGGEVGGSGMSREMFAWNFGDNLHQSLLSACMWA